MVRFGSLQYGDFQTDRDAEGQDPSALFGVSAQFVMRHPLSIIAGPTFSRGLARAWLDRPLDQDDPLDATPSMAPLCDEGHLCLAPWRGAGRWVWLGTRVSVSLASLDHDHGIAALRRLRGLHSLCYRLMLPVHSCMCYPNPQPTLASRELLTQASYMRSEQSYT